MKKTSKQFAIALYEATCDKKGKDLKEIVFNFVKILQKENKLGWQDKIIAALEKHARQEQGIEEIKISSARVLNRSMVNELKKNLTTWEPKLKQAKKIIITEKIDPGLLGGLILKFEDRIWDMTVKKQLQLLKKNLASTNFLITNNTKE